MLLVLLGRDFATPSVLVGFALAFIGDSHCENRECLARSRRLYPHASQAAEEHFAAWVHRKTLVAALVVVSSATAGNYRRNLARM